MSKKNKKNWFVKVKNPFVSEEDLKVFTHRSVSTKRFNTGIVRFSRFYMFQKTWVKYTTIIVLGIIMSLVANFFVKATGLYTGGTSAAFQGLARLTYALLLKGYGGIENTNSNQQEFAAIIYNVLFWCVYILFNIPLTIFAFKKLNKRFACLTIVYIVVSQGMGFVWGVIPLFANHPIQLFGDTSTVNEALENYRIQSIVFAPNVFPVIDASTGNFIWTNLQSASQTPEDIRSIITNEYICKALLLFVYAFIYSFFTAFAYTIMFILGGSTGGSDYITVYFSQIKNKSLGNMFIIINSFCLIVGVSLGSYTSGAIIDPAHYSGYQYFFSANLFMSLVWVVLNGILLEIWFPWQKLVRVEIYSNKADSINTYLKDASYTHPATILKGIGGYSGVETKVLVSVCMCVELPKLIQCVRTVDPNCLISSCRIADIDGTMAMQQHISS